MSDRLLDLIMSLIPDDGSSVGNGAMLALLRAQIPDISEEAYATARDALVDDGALGRGRGRGGSIYRADVTDMTLKMQVRDTPAANRLPA